MAYFSRLAIMIWIGWHTLNKFLLIPRFNRKIGVLKMRERNPSIVYGKESTKVHI